MYIAGVKDNGFPWIKSSPEHTCLRCAVQMWFARVKSINVPVIDAWVALTPKEALQTAVNYARGLKTV